MFYQLNKRPFIPILLLLILGCAESNKSTPYQILWYEEPAEVWEEALPLGNGRLGAMVFGHPSNERIQLNDDSLWPDDLQWEHPPGGPDQQIKYDKYIRLNWKNFYFCNFFIKWN